MRIFEIDDQDRNWAKIANVELDVDHIWENAQVLASLIRSNSNLQVNKTLLDSLVGIESNLSKIQNQELHDDYETKILKHKVKQMIDHIKKFKDSL
jgi:hypothetical protein